MLLATKCPYCKTTFKVANDQLKLQSGLVRCGICHQVFNGIEHLAQADTTASTVKINLPELAVAQQSAAPVADQTAPETATETETEPDLFDSFGISMESDTRVEPVLDMPQLADTFFPGQAPAQSEVTAEPVLPDADLEEIVVSAAFESESASPVAIADPLMDAAQAQSNQSQHQDSHSDEGVDDEALAQLLFIRQAKTRKRLRLLLSAGAVLLLLSLTGQATWQFRNYLAAAYPQTKTTLVALCRLAHCQISLPAQLDAISYEADELHSLAHENTFEFSLLMKNHATLTQAWPSIELTLKDPKKQVVLRRVFMPSEYLATPREELNGFQAGQEQAVKLFFVVDQVKATDYVVSIFYP